jgi:hypothetical protein
MRRLILPLKQKVKKTKINQTDINCPPVGKWKRNSNKIPPWNTMLLLNKLDPYVST